MGIHDMEALTSLLALCEENPRAVSSHVDLYISFAILLKLLK